MWKCGLEFQVGGLDPMIFESGLWMGVGRNGDEHGPARVGPEMDGGQDTRPDGLPRNTVIAGNGRIDNGLTNTAWLTPSCSV